MLIYRKPVHQVFTCAYSKHSGKFLSMFKVSPYCPEEIPNQSKFYFLKEILNQCYKSLSQDNLIFFALLCAGRTNIFFPKNENLKLFMWNEKAQEAFGMAVMTNIIKKLIFFCYKNNSLKS